LITSPQATWLVSTMRSSRVHVILSVLGVYVQAEYAKITNYQPLSDVTQHALIDLDQLELEDHLQNNDWDKAKAIYTQGGNSGATATITLDTALTQEFVSGVVVTQDGNAIATGKLKSTAVVGAVSITVAYTSVCKKGGSSKPDISGCFKEANKFKINDVDVGTGKETGLTYRTLAGFSTKAKDKMEGHEMYEIYRTYFKQYDYGNQKVLKALNGEVYTADDARRQVTKKSSVFLNVWMYTIREMEDAIIDCASGCGNDCNDDPAVHAWDEAVAFHSGSLAGETGKDQAGKLLWMQIFYRCQEFQVCDSNKLLEETMKFFTEGRDLLAAGKCTEAIRVKKRLYQLMTIPLIQGALKYGWRVEYEDKTSTNLRGEADSFAAAILPQMTMCDASAAKVVEENMLYDAASPMGAGFAAVKKAIESTYSCMGVTCKDIGALHWPKDKDGNFPNVATDAAACEDEEPSEEPSPAGGIDLITVIIIGVVLSLIGGVIGYCAAQNSKAGLLQGGAEMTA